jgi:hypothetical protein
MNGGQRARKLIVWTVAFLVALPGFYLALGALYFSRMVVSAIWTGVFQRPDFREATEDVVIFKIAEPGLFWGNVEFYSIISFVLWMVTLTLLFPLAIKIVGAFRHSKHLERSQ